MQSPEMVPTAAGPPMVPYHRSQQCAVPVNGHPEWKLTADCLPFGKCPRARAAWVARGMEAAGAASAAHSLAPRKRSPAPRKRKTLEMALFFKVACIRPSCTTFVRNGQ